jgi:hypothetical protein
MRSHRQLRRACPEGAERQRGEASRMGAKQLEPGTGVPGKQEKERPAPIGRNCDEARPASAPAATR